MSDVKTTVTETESVDCDVTEDMETDSVSGDMDTISTSPDMLSSPVSATAKAALLSNSGHKLFDYYLLPGSSTLVIQRLYLPVAVHSLSSTSRGCRHQPLRRLVLVCTLTKASPTETQEIKFITMLYGKFREAPDLIHNYLVSSCVKEPATSDFVYASN